MKAIRVHAFGEADVLTFEDVDDPRVSEGQVLVKVEAVGINPVETYVRAGAYALLPELPFIPGGDAAGTIAEIGAGVTGFSLGQRVYVAAPVSSGSYAQLMAVDVASVFPLHDSVSFGQGAAVGVPYATAYRALFQKAEAKAGETVFVHGASGAVGIASVQLAKAHGMRVVGSAGTERGKALVESHGADCVLDHTQPDYMDELAAFTRGAGPEVIVEMLANVNLNRDLAAIARFGRVIVVGNRGPTEIDARQTMGKDSSIRGMALWNASEAELASVHAALVAGLANGSLNPVVGREFPLAEAAAAHVAVLEPGAYGKIVLMT